MMQSEKNLTSHGGLKDRGTIWEAEIGNIIVQCLPGPKVWDSIWNITKAKRTGGVAEVVEHLPSSNPSTSKKKKTTKKNPEGSMTHGMPGRFRARGKNKEMAPFPRASWRNSAPQTSFWPSDTSFRFWHPEVWEWTELLKTLSVAILLQWCYESNYVGPKFTGWSPNPSISEYDSIADRISPEAIKVKWGIWLGPNPMTGVLRRGD
jgi:hypothetical protein